MKFRNSIFYVCFCTILSFLLLLYGVAKSEPDKPSDDKQQMKIKKEKIEKRIEMMFMWRLMDELDLSEENSEKIASLMKKSNARKREISNEQMKLLEELKKGVEKSKPEEAELKSLLDKIEKNDSLKSEVEEQLKKDLKKNFSVEQQAKFVIVWADFQKEIGQRIKEIREKSGKEDKGLLQKFKERREDMKNAPSSKHPGTKGEAESVK